MDFEIRRLTANEIPAAMELAWDTFLRFEAPDYGPEGVEAFRRTLIENEEFLDKCRSGENRLWGAFDGDTLIGLYGMRGGKSHLPGLYPPCLSPPGHCHGTVSSGHWGYPKGKSRTE